MAKLAATTCETVKPDPARDRLLGDGDGLSLRVRPNGTKTWVVEYVFQGKRTKYTIGGYSPKGAQGKSIAEWLHHGQLSLTQARSIAGTWKNERRAGHDPVEEWEAKLQTDREAKATALAAKHAEESAPTVREVIDLFINKIIAGNRSEDATRYRLDRLAEIIGDSKIRDVTSKEVTAALDTIAEGQREGKTAKQLAGEVLTLAKRVWRFAVERDMLPESCIANKTRGGIGAAPNKRDVVLRLDEVVAVWRALNDPERCKSDAVTVAALKLLILTGQRETEVCGAEWCEFDLDAGLWKIPSERTKTKRAHLVHLAPQAIAVLQGMKVINGRRPHVFASPLKPDQAIYGRSVNNALGTMFKRGLLPSVTRCHVHDFRRTLITRLPDLGFEPFIGHKIANHVMTGVFAHYNHNSYEAQREVALREWAARIEAMTNSVNVIQLARKGA